MPTVVSQNGWPASPDPAAIGVEPLTVAGVAVGDGLRRGDVATVLGHVLTRLHDRVESLVPGQCWGYKYRPVVGGVELSNHASGTAVDVNAPRHPLGVRGTFDAVQVDELHRVLDEVDHVVRWGGDYVGRVDEMHFEINADEAAVAAVAARLERAVQVLDYSRGYPGGTAIRAQGYGGAVRYLRKEGSSEVRPLTAAEVDDFHAHGLDLGLFYQHVLRDRPTQGRAAGQHDARWALEQAALVGVNVRSITMCVDFDATPSTVADYFRGVVDILGLERTGGYGSYRVLRYLFDQELIHYGHQTAAWSGGQREPRAHLFQRVGSVTVGGIDCDVNDVLQADWGQEGWEDDVSAPEVWGYDIVSGSGYHANAETWLWTTRAATERIEVKLDALAGTLSDDETKILAAIRAQGAGFDAPALAAALAPLLTPLERVPDEQLDALVTRLVDAVPTETLRRLAQRLTTE